MTRSPKLFLCAFFSKSPVVSCDILQKKCFLGCDKHVRDSRLQEPASISVRQKTPNIKESEKKRSCHRRILCNGHLLSWRPNFQRFRDAAGDAAYLHVAETSLAWPEVATLMCLWVNLRLL